MTPSHDPLRIVVPWRVRDSNCLLVLLALFRLRVGNFLALASFLPLMLHQSRLIGWGSPLKVRHDGRDLDRLHMEGVALSGSQGVTRLSHATDRRGTCTREARYWPRS